MMQANFTTGRLHTHAVAFPEQLRHSFVMFAEMLRLRPAQLFAALALASTGWSQSSRPGWGATPYHDVSGTGVTFRVWAPNATSIHVPGQFNSWSTTVTPLGKELTNGVWNGVWSANVTAASPGQQYKYYINYNGSGVWKHDPRARQVVSSSTSSGGNDIIYDPTAFNWSGDTAPTLALTNLVIYEIHIGTFYDPNSSSGLPGKFTDATNRLDYLKSLGVNAVEIMPIAEFPGSFSWGYNLADPFAADNYVYGGPDGFKTFVKACHARGLAVLLDVVHNHYGPTDLDLWNFDGWSGGDSGGGIYFYQDATLGSTPYGSRPNYSRQQVRDYIQQNFQMWLEEYHVDGFRWDTPGLMMNAGSTFISDAASLIATITAMMQTNYPGKLNIAEDVAGYGFDSTWDTTYPYVVTPVLTNAVDANRDLNAVVNALTTNQRFGFAAGFNRVVFLEDHDIVGDLNNGTRLPTAIDAATPNSYRARKLSTLGAALTFTAPGVPMIFQGQEMLENQPFSDTRPVDWTKTNTYSGIVSFYHDLIRLRRNLDGDVPGLTGDQCSFLQVDNVNQLLAYRRWNSSASNLNVVVVVNLSATTNNNYSLPFPQAGTWYVHFNSDSKTYGADYGNLGSSVVTASGINPTGTVSIGSYSALVLSQIPVYPSLAVGRTNKVVTVSWPNTFGGWALDTTPTLTGNPPPWTPVAAVQYHTNPATIFVNTTQSSGSVFFRLRKL